MDIVKVFGDNLPQTADNRGYFLIKSESEYDEYIENSKIPS